MKRPSARRSPGGSRPSTGQRHRHGASASGASSWDGRHGTTRKTRNDREGHAAAQPPRHPDAPQAEGLRGERASPPGPEARAAGLIGALMSTPAFYWGTGRRKTAVARVRLIPGEGSMVVNGRTPEEHFG